jgi:hypothetical protein
MVPKRLFTKIHFGGNENHTIFVSGEIGLCVNQGTGFLAKTRYTQSYYITLYKDLCWAISIIPKI